ncbi:isochorismatase hydrolase [Pseudomonas aeruginosa PA38182]|nr:isochorismatase hydrolase [Pseudomonas aeruginosa PA38182]
MSARQPKRALLVIDVQNEYVSGNLRIEFPAIQSSLERIGAAMDAAHAAGIPIVVVQHLAPADSPLFARGSRQAELHEVVASRPYQHKVEKQLASSFVGTGLAGWLRERDIDTLAVVGYMTQHCDDSTIRQAIHEAGRWNTCTTPAARCPTATAPARPARKRSTGSSASSCSPPSPPCSAPRSGWKASPAGTFRNATTSTTPTSEPWSTAETAPPPSPGRPSAQPTSEPRAGNGFQPGNSRSRGSGTAQ